MEKKSAALVFILFSIIYIYPGNLSSSTYALSLDDTSKTINKEQSTNQIKLIKTIGKISLDGTPDQITIYMHIPISCKEQRTIYIDVSCDRVKNYRFIKYDGTGVLMVADLIKGNDVYLNWTAYTLIKHNMFSDMPSNVSITKLTSLPDSVKQWIKSTDCCQSDDPYIISEAKTIAAGDTNIISIARKVYNRAISIPGTFNHIPISFDAYYALNWGNSCTGHAHAPVALLRALGIPARSILNIPWWYSGMMDQHWFVDFYVPDYGWVNFEPSFQQFPYPTSSTVITYISDASDEFSPYYVTGCDSKWAYSEPGLGEPGWGMAHHSDLLKSITIGSDIVDSILSLSQKVYDLYTDAWGLSYSAGINQNIQAAYDWQTEAFNELLANNTNGFFTDLNNALSIYSSLKLNSIKTIYFNDFESNDSSFTHYGTNDQWEKGKPQKPPYASYSGLNCWGTKMIGIYDNNADAYLQSPSVDLTNLDCAYLSFWTWNSVSDLNSNKTAGFHVEVSTDGVNYQNVMETLGGKIDDPAIPQKGGWIKIIIDLTNFVGNNIAVRFHFTSLNDTRYEGSFIDDFKIYGRNKLINSISDNKITISAYHLDQNYPNPFNSSTKIKFSLEGKSLTKLTIYDLLGNEVSVLVNNYLEPGRHEVNFNAVHLASGVYFYRLQAGSFVETKKCIILK